MPQNQGRSPLDAHWDDDVRRELARSYSIGDSFAGYLVGCAALLVLIVGTIATRGLMGVGRVGAMVGVLAVAAAIPALYVILGRRR